MLLARRFPLIYRGTSFPLLSGCTVVYSVNVSRTVHQGTDKIFAGDGDKCKSADGDRLKRAWARFFRRGAR